MKNKKDQKDEIKALSKKFNEMFRAIVWCTYRKHFNPLLSTNPVQIRDLLNSKYGSGPEVKKRMEFLHTRTDCGWGCTIRVA